ncbi:hypothetical protein E2C01_057989 [Portunus trituberculatus]|uniref:Uncharacterized protein n=1 Tax=Portunus trituberculatus TaxID=210409 RepID=A0A5B7GUF2_PORTR|nr:hypothetical protein [Portunus trituberculatus]
MTKFQGGVWWDSNLHMDVCPIPRLLPYPLRHCLPMYTVGFCECLEGNDKKI